MRADRLPAAPADPNQPASCRVGSARAAVGVPFGDLLRRAARNRLLLFSLLGLPFGAVVAARFYWPAHGVMDVTGQPIGRDFLNMWGGAKLALSGRVMDFFDLARYQAEMQRLIGHPLAYPPNWSYPPHLLLLIWPLGLMGYGPALALWTVATAAAFCWAVLAGTKADRGTTLAALLLAPASLATVISGQNGFLTAALFLAGLRLCPARPIVGGVLLGLLTIKPHLGVMLPFVLALSGNWRAFAATALTGAALVLAGIDVFGWEALIGYVSVTTRMQQAVLSEFHGFNTYMMTSVFCALRLLGADSLWSSVAQACVAVPVLATALVALRRTRDASLRILIAASATFLVSPYTFNYDMTLLTGALVWRNRAVARARGLEQRVYAAVWLLPLAIYPLHMIQLPATPVAVLALFGLAVRDAIKSPDPAPNVGEVALSTS